MHGITSDAPHAQLALEFCKLLRYFLLMVQTTSFELGHVQQSFFIMQAVVLCLKAFPCAVSLHAAAAAAKLVPSKLQELWLEAMKHHTRSNSHVVWSLPCTTSSP